MSSTRLTMIYNLCLQPSFVFDILLYLAKAGIDKVTVNSNVLENPSEYVTKEEMDSFVDVSILKDLIRKCFLMKLTHVVSESFEN